MTENTASTLVVPGRKKPYVMAHRGNQALCPENTIASFKQAISDGADILETDLQISKDGVFMCIHDGTLDRTTNGSGSVNQYSLEELKKISAGFNHPGFESETIPTLAELAGILPHDMALALELKTDQFLVEETAKQLINELSNLNIRNRVFVISFSKQRVLTIHKFAPDIPAGLISISAYQPDPQMQIVGPFWPLIFLNPFYPRNVKKNHQIVCPLDPNPEPRLKIYQWMRVDAVLTDNPQVTCAKIKKYEN